MESVANQQKSLKAMLDEKKDHRNVLLLYGRDEAQSLLIDQQETLNEVKGDFDKHELDVIVLAAGDIPEPDRQYLMQAFKLNISANFVGWLVSKAGKASDFFHEPKSAQAIFDMI